MGDQETINLDAAIREQMARSGESYSTARRAVLTAEARRAVDNRAWPGLVPEPYDQIGGGFHHDAALLHNVLRAAGIVAPHTSEPFTEAMLLGIGGGVGFAYSITDYAGYHPTLAIVTTPTDVITRALDRLGVSHSVRHAPNARVAERNLDDALAAGVTPICTVDRMGLPWHGCVDLIGGAEPHALAVLGGKDILWFDDECVRPTPMERQFFLAAWGWFVRGRHRLIRIAENATARTDLADAIRDGVATTVALLSRPRGAASNTKPTTGLGRAGMRMLTGHLGDSRAPNGWLRRYADPEVFFHALRRLHDCVDIDSGGPGAARPLYASFLDEATSMAGGGDWREPAGLFRCAGIEWSGLAADVVAAHPAFSEYNALLTERLQLQLEYGTDAAEAIAALNVRMAGLATRYAAEPLSPKERRDLLDRLAARVAQAVTLEDEAVRGLVAAFPR